MAGKPIKPIKKSSPRKTASRSEPTADEKIAQYTEDAIVDALSNGKSMAAICKEIGVSNAKLCTWIAADEKRSARAKEARSYAARIWDERAEDVIAEAGNPFELAQAKELAHHYRWRASKIAPRDYGDRVQAEVTGANGGAIAVASLGTMSGDQLDAYEAALASAVAIANQGE